MRLLLLSLFLLVASCAKSEKRLFTEWTSSQTNHSWHLEDRGWGLGRVDIWVSETNWCNCELEIYGDEKNAYGRLSDCVRWGDASEANQCSYGGAYDGQHWYTFTRRETNLKICKTDVDHGNIFCSEYR